MAAIIWQDLRSWWSPLINVNIFVQGLGCHVRAGNSRLGLAICSDPIDTYAVSELPLDL